MFKWMKLIRMIIDRNQDDKHQVHRWNNSTWTTNHSMSHKKKTMGKLMVNVPHQLFFQKHKNKELRVESEMVCNNYTNFMF
jgi:hypothetical protein